MMGFCYVCKTTQLDETMLAHLKNEHPAEWGGGPELWPDGEVVIHDETLKPEDFT
jgi:hypothetical protein